MLRTAFQPKGPRLRVIEGADIDRKIWLAGERIVIGSAPTADLALTAPGVAPEHAVLTPGVGRDPRGRPWLFSLADDAWNQLDGRPSPRAGQIAPGQRLRLGPHTEVLFETVPLTDDAPVALTADLPGAVLPASTLWAVRLALVVAVAMVLFVVLRPVWEENTPTAAPEAERDRLEVEAMFCDPAISGSEAPRETPLLRAVAECMGYDTADELPSAVFGDVKDMTLEAYFDIRAGDTVAGARSIDRLTRLLGPGSCPLAIAVARDLELLNQGVRAASCPGDLP
ncbi:MAG: FHA domain-containing protein [Pseudomonadota bacterium]